MTDLAPEDQLALDIGGYAADPLGFVRYAFPWSQPGTSLERIAGPEDWAIDLYTELGEHLRSTPHVPFRKAVASGKGITKTATMAQLALWAMSTRTDTRGLVTANTEQQLITKTWPEFHKWYHLLICRHWFDLSATVLRSRDPKHGENWKFDRVTWSEHNLEAAQGLHNEGKRIIAEFDEASRIADPMWDATAGIETDKNAEVIWLVFGNPTRNVGRFYECFHRFRHRWRPAQVDSREVRVTNKANIQQWVDDYGEDSDKVRVWVRGLFPRAASTQLIPTDVIEDAAQREPVPSLMDPLIMGIDCAREGDDDNVIRSRRGRDGKSYPSIHLHNVPGPVLADRAAQQIQAQARLSLPYHAIFIDCTGGYGWSVYDSMVALGYAPIACNFAQKATQKGYANMRMQIYANVAQWLAEGGAIAQDELLIGDLKAQEYTHQEKTGLQILVPKSEIKAETERSPDDSDALALTFWAPVTTPAQEAANVTRGYATTGGAKARTEYDPFA